MHRSIVSLILVLPLVVITFFGGTRLMAQSDTTTATPTATSHSFYDLRVKTLSGEDVSLERFRGKVALVVNTASNCGFTSQYKGLEELYQKYKERGFVVLGFPSNDFGGQEPGSNAEIKQFCELKYRTTFPMFEKNAVSGDDKQPAYKFLTELSASEFHGDPGWNFVKFLVDKNGTVIGRFSSMTSPAGGKIERAIEAALK
jgi:glutathione peroxidase